MVANFAEVVVEMNFAMRSGNTRLVKGVGLGLGFELGIGLVFVMVLGVERIIKYRVECNVCITCTTLCM